MPRQRVPVVVLYLNQIQPLQCQVRKVSTIIYGPFILLFFFFPFFFFPFLTILKYISVSSPPFVVICALIQIFAQQSDFLYCFDLISLLSTFPTEIRIVETDHDTLKSVMDIAIDRSAMDQWSSQPAAAASPSNRPSRPKDPCVICTEEPIAPKSLSCGHTFCMECIDKWLKTRAICPTCNKSQGVHCGNQEVGGTMEMTYSRYCVHGFEFTGSYIIFYSFLSGKQTVRQMRLIKMCMRSLKNHNFSFYKN